MLLLLAGSLVRTRAMSVPNTWPEHLGSTADWVNVTTDQADAGAVAYLRGRALGGSSAINAMAHVRGHRAVVEVAHRGQVPRPVCCSPAGSSAETIVIVRLATPPPRCRG